MFKCALCAKTFSKSFGLGRHMVTHTKEKPHKCLICTRVFSLESSLKRHIRIVHEGFKQTIIKNHHCPKCSYKCYSKSMLQNHARKHSAERPFSCQITGCGFKTKHKSSLSKHASQTHSDKRPFHCSSEGCNYKGKTRGQIREHLKVHGNDRPFHCRVPGCNYASKSKANLKNHNSTVHHNEMPFKCSVCDFRTKYPSNFRRHELTHTKDKRFHCQRPNCGFAGQTRSILNEHFDRKHRAKEVCTEPRYNFICDSVALREVNLQRHKLPILPCPEGHCGFSTRYNRCLLEHSSRRHKDFQSSVRVMSTRMSDLKTAGATNTLHCSFTDCGYQTKFRYHYDRHVIAHKKEEKRHYVCSFCFARFTTSKGLKVHGMRHIREKPYTCSYCYYKTMHSFQLRKHPRTKHQIHVIPRGRDDEVRKCRTCNRNCFSYGESVLHSMSHLKPVVVLARLQVHTN